MRGGAELEAQRRCSGSHCHCASAVAALKPMSLLALCTWPCTAAAANTGVLLRLGASGTLPS